MEFTATLFAAALAATTAADFVVVTAFPTSINLDQLANSESYISSLAGYLTEELASFTASEKAKIQKKLAPFAATASYSIRSEVTALSGLDTFAVFTSVPDWYSALPSDVKSYYDKYNEVVMSILFQGAGIAQTSTASGSGTVTRSGTGATASQTGAASKVAVMGAGMTAAFLGVIAL